LIYPSLPNFRRAPAPGYRIILLRSQQVPQFPLTLTALKTAGCAGIELFGYRLYPGICPTTVIPSILSPLVLLRHLPAHLPDGCALILTIPVTRPIFIPMAVIPSLTIIPQGANCRSDTG